MGAVAPRLNCGRPAVLPTRVPPPIPSEKINRPMVLVGASLGGAIALDFAMEHPEVRAGRDELRCPGMPKHVHHSQSSRPGLCS